MNRDRLTFRAAVGALALTLAMPAASDAQGPVVLFSADRGGALAPCGDCPEGTAPGGAARMGTLVREQRVAGPVLLLDAGNAFFGSIDATGEAGVAVRDFYDAVAYDVVNIGFRDFRYGLAATRDLLAKASFTPVSANLLDAERRPLFDPFAVKDIGGRRIAIVGVTQSPPGLDYLPHLQRQLAGILVADPLESLAEVLPLARTGADHVVLLCYGDRELLDAVYQRFGSDVDAIAVGGLLPADLPEGATTFLAASSPDGRALTRFVLGGEPRAELLEVGPELVPDGDVQALLAGELVTNTQVLESVSRPAPVDAILAPGAPIDVDVRSSDSGLGSGLILRVASVARRPVWQGLEAPPGRSWMVFRLSVENDIPASLAFGGSRAAGEKLLVVQKQRLFLLCGEDARAVLPAVSVDKPADPASLLPGKFRLDYVGDSRAGEVAFAANEEAFAGGPLQLRLYHDEVPLAAVDVRGEVLPDEDTGSSGNDYVMFAQPVLSFPDTIDGRVPPKGARWVNVSLRGRSQPPASRGSGAKKPKGRIDFGALASSVEDDDADDVGAKARPLPAFYLEAGSHLELLVDGLWARRAESDLGSLPPEPVFLPDRFTGGTAVFVAPEECASLELSCAFPLITLENGDELVPEVVRLPLEGQPVVPQPEEAAVVIDDGPLPLAVIGVERTDAIGEFVAEEDRTLLVFDCRVENRTAGGMYGPSERLLLADARPLATLDRADLPLGEPFLVPADARRAFRVVLDAPQDVGGPTELTYAGVSVRPTFSLDVPFAEVEEAVTAEAEADAETDAPVELGDVWSEHALPVIENTWSPATLPAGPLDLDPAPVSAAELTLDVGSVAVAEELNGYKSREGEVFLEFEVEVRLAKEAAPLAVTRLHELLYGLVDHRVISGYYMRRKQDLPLSFELQPGEALSGSLVFVMPIAGWNSFAIELVVPGREAVHVPVLQPTAPLPSAFASASNEAFEVEVLGFSANEEIDELQPLADHVFVAVELRARNHLVGIGSPAGLLAWDRMVDRIQLVVDGLHSFPMRRAVPCELNSQLTLFPKGRLGGRAVFEVPKSLLARAAFVEVVCGFEPVEIPGGGLLSVAPLRIPLVGERPELALPEGIHRIEDIDCTVVVAALERTEAFRGAPGHGAVWVVADLWIAAPSDRGVVIAPERRFGLVDGDGGWQPIYPTSWAGSPSPGGRPFWIPAGGVRRLTAGFRVPAEKVDGAVFLHRGLVHTGPLPIGPQRALPRRELPAPLEPRGLAGVGLTPEEVNRAIDRGRDFLWKGLQAGMSKGELAGERNDVPVLLALVHCGAHEAFPEFGAALRRLLTRTDVRQLGVYELGLMAMILDGLDDPEFEDLFEEVQLCLVEGQGPGGFWNYYLELADRLFPAAVAVEASAELRLEVIGGGPPDSDERDPIERTQSWYSNSDGDNSVSQFAVLGLAAAEHNGIEIGAETWRRVLEGFCWRQNVGSETKYGGWGYGDSAPYGSMTCSGICSTAIALRRFDPELDPRENLRIRDGLAWLDRNWTLTKNPQTNDWHYYYLYGLERVGRILDIEFIGEHEWYPEGAKYLVAEQNGDGSWTAEGHEADTRLPTSFALLFLTRATESLGLDEEVEEEVSGPGTLQTSIELPPGTDNVYVILDASGSMLSEIAGRRKFDVARDAVRQLIAGLPAEAQFALRVYGHRKRAIEDGAEEDTELIAPFTELDREALFATLDGLRPRGKTPLTLSLQQARKDLGTAPKGRDTLVVLLTDGGEDTRQDPVAAAAAWQGHPTARLWVVGFDINRPEWTRQLHAIADAAGGQYVAVERAEELSAKVVAVVAPEPPLFDVLDEAGESVARARFGESLPLDPGAYSLSFHYRDKAVSTPFWIRPGATVRVRLDARTGEH